MIKQKEWRKKEITLFFFVFALLLLYSIENNTKNIEEGINCQVIFAKRRSLVTELSWWGKGQRGVIRLHIHVECTYIFTFRTLHVSISEWMTVMYYLTFHVTLTQLAFFLAATRSSPVFFFFFLRKSCFPILTTQKVPFDIEFYSRINQKGKYGISIFS